MSLPCIFAHCIVSLALLWGVVDIGAVQVHSSDIKCVIRTLSRYADNLISHKQSHSAKVSAKCKSLCINDLAINDLG